MMVESSRVYGFNEAHTHTPANRTERFATAVLEGKPVKYEKPQICLHVNISDFNKGQPSASEQQLPVCLFVHTTF